MAVRSFTVIGVPDRKAEARLRRDEDCFGQHFAKTAEECKRCLAPVLYGGRVLTMRDVCRAECEEAAPVQIKRLTSGEVYDRIARGDDVVDIWEEILDGQDPEVAGVDARTLLSHRLRYLGSEKGLSVPRCPSTKRFIERSQS